MTSQFTPTMEPITKLIINGEQRACISGKQIPLIDASTGKEWLRVDEAGPEDVEVAVECAEKAWRGWHALPGHTKAATIRRFASLILENGKDLGYYEAKGNGKPVSLTASDYTFTARVFNHCAALCETDHAEATTTTPGQLNYVIRSPFGVTAAIIPWNVPMIMFSFKVAPAIAAGNAVILKSSEKAPLTSLLLGQLAIQAGFPPGLIQVLSGYGPTVGAALASHMKIRKIGFTGSATVGRLIQQMAAQSNLKNVTLELGGKSPNIIFGDADVKNAVDLLTGSLMSNSGQNCFAATRLYVESCVKDEFLAAYKSSLSKFVPGPHMDSATKMGPLVDLAQFTKVKRYLEAGKKEGVAILGGNAIEGEGYFVPPTIYVGVSDEAVINKEEIFGPVVVIHTFDSEDEAIKRANDSEYGLYAAVFTKNIDRAMRVSTNLEAGVVGINCTSPTILADMPFGGHKASGIGRELGPHSLREWQESKTVFIKYPKL